MKEVTIRAASNTTKTAMSLCFTSGTEFPISGFPRRLHIDHLESPGLPGRLGLKTVGSIRWASRSGSQRQRRLDWTPPDLPPPKDKEDIIARYSDSRHLLGSATSLVSMADAFAAHTPPPVARFPNVSAQYSPVSMPGFRFGPPRTTPIHELPALEITHELPAIEIVHELPGSNAFHDSTPKFWMADEDWTGLETRGGSGSVYMDLTCGDVLQVREEDRAMWRVVRPSDGKEGWVPRRCLRPLENVLPPPPRSPAGADSSPIGGSYW